MSVSEQILYNLIIVQRRREEFLHLQKYCSKTYIELPKAKEACRTYADMQNGFLVCQGDFQTEVV